MRKLLLVAAALCCMVCAHAQDSFAIMGGVTSSSTVLEDFSFDNLTQYHAGVAYKKSIALGFAVQPELWYNVKGTSISSDINDFNIARMDLKIGYAEAGLQLQWGPDLVLFRPFVFVEPFVGYAVNDKLTTSALGGTLTSTVKNVWDNVSRLEYGYGIGGGLELFGTLQISAKHFQNLGSLYEEGAASSLEDYADYIKTAFQDRKGFGGWVVTLGILF